MHCTHTVDNGNGIQWHCTRPLPHPVNEHWMERAAA